jgi:hypothetical protein
MGSVPKGRLSSAKVTFVEFDTRPSQQGQQLLLKGPGLDGVQPLSDGRVQLWRPHAKGPLLLSPTEVELLAPGWPSIRAIQPSLAGRMPRSPISRR